MIAMASAPDVSSEDAVGIDDLSLPIDVQGRKRQVRLLWTVRIQSATTQASELLTVVRENARNTNGLVEGCRLVALWHDRPVPPRS
jgi:hypothetical protein